MSISYYSNTADETHWRNIWEQQHLDNLLAIAAYDPLSQYLAENLPKSGLILEGGCGLGQYVSFFRQKGYNVVGGDFSLVTLKVHRQTNPSSPLLGLDLRQLPFADEVFAGHISIGVIEHLEEGPQMMLRELYRTLAPGGTLLVSVPWVNGARRLLIPLILYRQRQYQATGATFYQYAYRRQELHRFLTEAGFIVQAFHPYSPAKGAREILHLMRPKIPNRAPLKTRPMPAQKPIADHLLRRLLYLSPVLWSFAHMILVIAQKPINSGINSVNCQR